jgi:hypothetical protein
MTRLYSSTSTKSLYVGIVSLFVEGKLDLTLDNPCQHSAEEQATPKQQKRASLA